MAVDTVIFDWGGTLTPWQTADGRGWWRIAARLVPHEEVDRIATVLHEAEEDVWRRAREDHLSGKLAEVFAAAGIQADERAYRAYDEEWEFITYLDPYVIPLMTGLRERGLRIGVLSNTVWTRSRHEQIFARDGVDDLIDGAVYTSEIPWTKPHPEAFRTAMAAVGASDPRRCVFVGDRPFDDIFGASQVGMRTVLMPHSQIPEVQRGHTQGQPDAVIANLLELLEIIDAWRHPAAPRSRADG